MAKKTKTNTVKLTESEIKDLENIRFTFSELTRMIGENEINITGLQGKKAELVENLNKLREKQNEVVKGLEDKYGKGKISLDTNEFTPTQE